MSFADPYFFVAFVFLALAVFWTLATIRKRRPSIQFSNIQLFASMAPSLRSRLQFLPALLKVIAISIMIFALARPQTSDSKIKRNVEGIDIVFTLDISDSMLIEDMPPAENRLESAKSIAKDFIEKRVSDRIGLVLFCGEAFTQVPPTLDYKILLTNLAQVKTGEGLLKMGTAIGVALANAVARLKDSTAKSRVIILLTDGENNSGTIDPETALEVAKGYGLRVYTIGVGVDGMSQLPIYYQDAFGNKRKRYQPMHSSVNDDLLGKIASETGGKYYRATNTQALKNVFDDISKLERTKIEVNKFTKFTELFQNYLRWAVLIYIIAVLLNRVVIRRGP